MKKFLGVLAVMVAIVSTLAGCSANAAYSAEERQVIDTANKLICNECDVTFDADDFYYSSGIHAKWKEVLMASVIPYANRMQRGGPCGPPLFVRAYQPGWLRRSAPWGLSLR